MLEGMVAEVQVRSMSFDDSDNRVFCDADQVDRYISAGAAHVSPWTS